MKCVGMIVKKNEKEISLINSPQAIVGKGSVDICQQRHVAGTYSSIC